MSRSSSAGRSVAGCSLTAPKAFGYSMKLARCRQVPSDEMTEPVLFDDAEMSATMKVTCAVVPPPALRSASEPERGAAP